jgi:hypothetical protein
MGPKAVSVTSQGEPDGWVIQAGFESQLAHDGGNRLLVSVPTERLVEAHIALVGMLGKKVGVLYRQFINRANPGPNNAPPVDFVGLDIDSPTALSAIRTASSVIYHDARCELWLRGSLGDQVILDRDGLIYCYPDDPGFRDVLSHLQIEEHKVEVLLERDYVKHSFYAENDAVEEAFVSQLELTRIGT